MSVNALNAYSQNRWAGLEQASPAKLIAALLDEALASCQLARLAIANKNVALKAQKASKALSILTEGLMPALNLQAGGEIAANLLSLYEYCVTLLFDGNLRSDAAKFEECEKLLSQIREGWRAVESLPAA